MNEFIFIWMIGAMFGFGMGNDRNEEPTLFGFFLLLIRCLISWPIVIGGKIEIWMDREK